MTLSFMKMQGLGNDFVVINAIETSFNLNKKEISFLADRHYGVGSDQVLVLEKARDTQEDFFYRIFNADGSEVGQCGNGARCIALFIRDQRLSESDSIRLGTITTHLVARVCENHLIEVSMGEPVFAPQKIPFLPEKMPDNQITTPIGEVDYFVLNLGNPHIVITVPEVSKIDVNQIGKTISQYPAFPEQTNVIFMELFNPRWIKCRIYERGVGETLACGSGACAAVVAGIHQSLLNETVLVTLPGGELEVTWDGKQVWLKGPAKKVFRGEIDDLENTSNT